MQQHDLFSGSPSFRSQVINRRKDFEALFKGFTKMRAISYVASPNLLLEFLEQQGYTELELVVGDSLTEVYRQELAQKGIDVTERLVEQVEKGAIRIWVPDRIVHTKLYILETSKHTRVILSSANLTESARRAKQVNYSWYADLPPSHPWLQRVIEDYEAHRNGCSLFMGDLIELFRGQSEVPRRELVDAWLKGTLLGEANVETRRILQEISVQALESVNNRDEAIITLRLPEASPARKQLEKSLARLKPSRMPDGLRVNGTAFLRYVQETHGFPVMRVDWERQEVVLGLNGSRLILTEPLPDMTSLNTALQNIEDYIQTVDSGQSSDPKFAKTSMFEALLYVFFTPFASEYMKAKRRAFASVDTRGPRFLYIYGPSQNGKSTFLKFALKLLTGQQIQPIPGDYFTKTKILDATFYGTVFPLIFDDVPSLQSTPNIQEALKSYWEVWWREELVQPQIIVSSNMASLNGMGEIQSETRRLRCTLCT